MKDDLLVWVVLELFCVVQVIASPCELLLCLFLLCSLPWFSMLIRSLCSPFHCYSCLLFNQLHTLFFLDMLNKCNRKGLDAVFWHVTALLLSELFHLGVLIPHLSLIWLKCSSREWPGLRKRWKGEWLGSKLQVDRVFLLENSSKIGKPRILYCIAKVYGVWSFRSCFGRFGILKGSYISCLKLWNKQYVYLI